MSRMIGMGRSQAPPPLLRQIGNKPRSGIKQPSAVEDPPLSSDDEEENDAESISQHSGSNASHDSHGRRPGSRKDKRGALLEGSGSSDEDRTARGSIAQTNFGKPAPTRTLLRARGDGSDIIESLDSGTKRSNDDQIPSNKRPRCSKSSPSTLVRGTGAHLTDKFGFSRTNVGKKTYGSRANSKLKTRGATEGAASKQRANETRRPTRAAEGQAASKARFKVPKSPDSPEKPSTGKLIVPKDMPWSSPTKPSRALRTSKYLADDIIDKDSDSPQADSAASSSSKATAKKKRGKREFRPPAELPSDSPVVVKMSRHSADFGRGADGSDGKPDVVLSDVTPDAEKSDLEVIGSDTEAAAVCPWCGQPVDKSFLDSFSRGKRMNVRLQTRFCRQHKKQTAVETWQAKGYPEVDWEGLDRRFAAHRGLLLDIVNGKASHFRGILAQKVESGQARSMKKEENMNPGYYGPRGFDLMCDYLVDEFGELLKGRAVDDRVIAGRGSAAFIQTVLVPELAVLLIVDDMGVSVEEAMSIMEESKALGEMVHEGA